MIQQSITLGIFNHLFIIGTLSIVSFVISFVIFWLKSRTYLPKVYVFLGGSFIFLGLYWLSIGLQTFFASQAESFLSQTTFYIGFIFLGITVSNLIYFIFNVLYENLQHIYKIFITFLFGIIPALTIFFSPPVNNGLTQWGNTWLLSSVSLSIFGLLMILPVTMAFLMFFIYAFDNKYKEQHLERLIMKLGSVFMILYFFITFVDYYIYMNGWSALWIRLGLLGVLFLFLLLILHKRLRTYGFKADIRLRNPLMIKGAFYSLFTTIFPLIVAAYLLTFSFHKIILVIVEEEYQNIAAEFEKQIIMTSIILGFLSFFVSLFIMKILENKLKRIIQGMYEVLNNNFEYRIKNAKPYDELGSLSMSFNDMARDLDGYSDEIDKYSDLLEQKVQDRTKELEAKSYEAKKLIEEINQNSERLSHQTDNITDQMQDGLLVLDVHNTIVRYNQAFKNIFHLPEDDFHRKSFLKIPIITEYEEFKIMLEKFNSENLETYQQKVTLKPPLSGMLECRLTSFNFNEGERGTIFILRDISLPWGVVYESETKEPVSGVVVRLYNEANNKIIAEEITDEVGRFMFYVNPGNYYVRLFKDGYNFPSKSGIGYHGEVITIEDKKDSVIHFDVLIDKLG